MSKLLIEPQNTVTTEPPVDTLTLFNELHQQLEKMPVEQDIRHKMTSLSKGLSQMIAEHRGMADELLCAYEQLGIIFEITKHLSGVQKESEMLDLFISTLRKSFIGRQVHLARLNASQSWTMDDSTIQVGGWLNDVIDRSRDQNTILVESPEPEEQEHAFAEVMVGPLTAGQNLIGMIVLSRTGDNIDFHSSEMLLVDSLTRFCGDLIQNLQLVKEMREMSVSMVRSLVNAVDQKDEYTCGHSLRVAYYATLLGRELNLDEVELQMLQWSALLHDVGKIGIRDDVLKKKGKLTDEEFTHIKEHPVRSHMVVQEVTHLENALDGILYHHEHFDGTGYPSGLKGNQIPRQARIIQIADVFDALTSSRSYRSAYTWQQALQILSDEAGKTVDPHLQKNFDSIIREKMSGGDAAWEQMVAQATRFTQTPQNG